MLTTITFNELKDIIAKKTNDKVNLDFTYIDYYTVKVSYKPVAFLPAVNVNVQIREVGNSRIILSYNANNAVDMIIKGLASYLENHIPKEIVILDTSNQSVTIYPDKIEQLQKPLEMIDLQQLYFENGKVCVEIKVN